MSELQLTPGDPVDCRKPTSRDRRAVGDWRSLHRRRRPLGTPFDVSNCGKDLVNRLMQDMLQFDDHLSPHIARPSTIPPPTFADAAGRRLASFSFQTMKFLVEPGSVLNLGKEQMEFRATPVETGDRYLVRMTVEVGGGPGVRGFGPHIHDGFTEVFNVVAGRMKYRNGGDTGTARPGDRIEVPPGYAHGFKNVGDDELAVDVEIKFGPDGPTPETDPVPLGVTVARLMQEGKVSRLTGFPPIMQLAVVEYETPKATREAGLAGLLMPPLAWLGRRLGYKPDPFEVG